MNSYLYRMAPIIILSLKLENFAVKSNSENRFTSHQKNSEYAVKKKKTDKNGKNLS